jgi:spermidine/putrescine transport system substrate-binding protein
MGYSQPSQNIVNVYNWAAYLPFPLIMQFEKETGIKVNYSTFDSNEILYTKIKTNPKAGYDVIVPSADFLERMIDDGLLQKIDKTQLTNLHYINPHLLNRAFDKNNQYSVPYLWGTTGLIFHRHYYSPSKLRSWSSLFGPHRQHRVAFLNDIRNTFSLALKTLGYSINDENPEHIRTAYLKLRTLLPHILSFGSGEANQIYINEDALIGVIENGDALIVQRENAHFDYIFPKEGAIIWIDSMAIPAGAQHVNNAHRFINFILRPDVAKRISMKIGYSTPNWKALTLMPKAMRDNRVFNPSKTDLINAEIETKISDKAQRLYLKYWELLKLGI